MPGSGGRCPPTSDMPADLMIAASALARQATVVTRNSSDFEPTGASLLNPF